MRRHVTWHFMRGYTYIYILKTSPRVVSCACVIGGSCTNCGVSRTTNGLCSRCLSLPSCKKMQAQSSRLLLQWGTTLHLPGTFTRRYRMYYPSLHTGTETLQVALSFDKSLSHRYTFSRLCLLTELWKATHHTTYHTKQLHIRNYPTRYRIRYLVRNAYQHSPTRHRRHRSRRLTSAWVLTCLFFYSRCKFVSSFTFRV